MPEENVSNMSEENSNFTVRDLAGISEPTNTLIKKISKAIEGIHKPSQIKRLALAEAEAAIIKAKSDAAVAIIEANTEIQIRELHQRAIERLINEETKKQKNIEDITNQATIFLSENANAEKMDDDWITNFFEKARNVSDKEMQGLWARVLANEANEPGIYSKRTISFLADLEKTDAELFTKLCGFGWLIGKFSPLIFDAQENIYKENGITFSALTHLESIGLIQFNFITGFIRRGFTKVVYILYYEQPFQLEMPKDENNELQIGQVLLTKIGQELAPICGSVPIDGFDEYVKQRWKNYSMKQITQQENFQEIMAQWKQS